MDKLNKPILKFVSSSQHTITLKLIVDIIKDNYEINDISFIVQIKDPLFTWITKYWGLSKEVTIRDLSPQHIYTIRFGISIDFNEAIWSDCIIGATQPGPKWTYYMFKSIATCDNDELESFLSERSNTLEAVNSYGETPLLQSARLGNINGTEILLNSGCNPNSKMFPSLQTPLMAACFAGHEDIVKCLVEQGSNWLDRDICGRDALHYAVSNSQLETVKMAIEGGCNVNSRDNYSCTPLMRAVILNASSDVLTQLLLNGGDVQLKDDNNQTCLDMAYLYKNENIILLLAKRDEDEILQDKTADNFEADNNNILENQES